MPLQAPTRDEAFAARIQHSATMGLTAPGSDGGPMERAVAALQDDMIVYAELNDILGEEDLDGPAPGKEKARTCRCARKCRLTFCLTGSYIVCIYVWANRLLPTYFDMQ